MTNNAPMIYQLDDVSRRLYMKLKADEDSLVRVSLAIECKKKLLATLMDVWLDYEKMEMDVEADRTYDQKYNLEVEIAALEREQKALQKKVTRHAS